MAASFTKPRFLLCEGEADKRVFEALIRERNLPEFQIVHAAEWGGVGGRSGFPKAMKDIHVLSGFDSVQNMLLVSDNDALNTSFGEVQRALKDNGYEPPNAPEEVGRVREKPVMALMIPSHDTVGDLESLCLPAIYARWPNAERCVEAFLDCTGALGWAKRSSLSKARARSAAVGFYEDDPYKGIGILFETGVLSTANACFDGIAEFLRNFDSLCAGN